MTIGYESVTVPAGTFINCLKTESTSSNEVTDVWFNSSVPIFGIVKSTSSENGSVVTTIVLQSYGS